MSIRGIRQTINGGNLIGNMGSSAGPAQEIPFRGVARAIGAAGPAGLAFGQIQDGDTVANISGAANTPVGVTESDLLDYVFGNAQGGILYRDALAWKFLGPGTSGQYLKTLGAAANPLWATIPVTVFVDAEIPTGVVDGTNAVFTLANAPTAGSVHLYLNGLRMRPTTDYGIVGTTLTYTAGAKPQSGDNHYVDYRK